MDHFDVAYSRVHSRHVTDKCVLLKISSAVIPLSRYFYVAEIRNSHDVIVYVRMTSCLVQAIMHTNFWTFYYM